MNYIKKNSLKIDSILFEFVNSEALPGTNLSQDDFWNGFEEVVNNLAPVNKKLIEKEKLFKKRLIIGILKIKAKILIKMNTSNF